MTEILPPTFAIIPLAAAIALVVFTIAMIVHTRREGRRVTPGAILWPVPFIAMLAGMAWMCSAEMCIFEPTLLVIFSLAVEALGALTLARTYIVTWLDQLDPASGRVMEHIGMTYRYSYVEQWQPKDVTVTFRLYQINFQGDPGDEYRKYRELYPEHFVETI